METSRRSRSVAAVHRAALSVLSATFALSIAVPAAAATIWSGVPVEFAKGDFVDTSDPANQDSILPGVALTRGASQGIFNAAMETSYSGSSPADTEWAWVLNNPGQEISAANYAELDFAPWAQAHGGSPPATLDIPGVLHIISADVYIDITFTAWTIGGGGGFAYTRSTPVPEPATLPLLVVAATGWGTLVARRRRS